MMVIVIVVGGSSSDHTYHYTHMHKAATYEGQESSQWFVVVCFSVEVEIRETARLLRAAAGQGEPLV